MSISAQIVLMAVLRLIVTVLPSQACPNAIPSFEYEHAGDGVYMHTNREAKDYLRYRAQYVACREPQRYELYLHNCGHDFDEHRIRNLLRRLEGPAKNVWVDTHQCIASIECDRNRHTSGICFTQANCNDRLPVFCKKRGEHNETGTDNCQHYNPYYSTQRRRIYRHAPLNVTSSTMNVSQVSDKSPMITAPSEAWYDGIKQATDYIYAMMNPLFT